MHPDRHFPLCASASPSLLPTPPNPPPQRAEARTGGEDGETCQIFPLDDGVVISIPSVAFLFAQTFDIRFCVPS